MRKKGRSVQTLTANPSGTDSEALSPRPLMRLLGDFGNSQILYASLEYDFFTIIHKGSHTYEEIARQAGTHPRATRIVLDGLISLRLVEKRKGQYYLAPLSENFLVRGKDSYFGDFRHVALSLWDGMAQLKETLKSGKPLSRMDTESPLEVWEKLVVGIIPIAEPAAQAACDLLKIGVEKKGLRILDIAGGSSIFGMTALERDPSARVTQIDWPNVNAVAKKLNHEKGLEGKIRFVDGDFRSTNLTDDQYDLVIASNFCRFESPAGNCELFRKAFQLLQTSGTFLINDFLPDEERTGPPFVLRFSVYTLTHTPEGECYTLSQYSSWLREAGFTTIESHTEIPRTLPGTTLILARK